MSTQAQEPLTVSLETAAKLCGISRSLAYDLARRNEFPGCIRLGNRWLVSKRVIEKLLVGEIDSKADL